MSFKLTFLVLLLAAVVDAFSPAIATPRAGATTIEAPPTDDIAANEFYNENDDDDGGNYSDLEYLIDSDQFREFEDPFHILLMGSTFEKPKITVPYVAGSLEYVLQMPPPEAETQSKFARDEGMACLGTWTREECLSLGRQLQRRDLECRVVPFCQGGQRSWQARDAKAAGGVTSE